jgi:hypothetical protein
VRRLKVPFILVMLAGAGAAGWWVYARWPRLAIEYDLHRVASAATFTDAQREIARLEDAADRDRRLAVLVSAWGTGDARFDEFLVQHVQTPQCGDALREWFSLEISSRPGMLGRWATYWSRRLEGDIAAEIDSMREYLETLARTDPPRRITWREVLDLQAAMVLTGHEDLARRLKPDTWRDRFTRWIEQEDDWPETFEKPDVI